MAEFMGPKAAVTISQLRRCTCRCSAVDVGDKLNVIVYHCKFVVNSRINIEISNFDRVIKTGKYQ